MQPYRTKGQLVIAIDDTDNAEEGGTGRVAREIACRLSERFAIWGVSRHQFAVLPEIPYTRNNSGNAIHVLSPVADVAALTDEVAAWLRELCLPGSDPGLCLAAPAALLEVELGRAAQARVVSRDEARRAAEAAGVMLRHPCETDDGIVGALAGACLAAGGEEVRSVEGDVLSEGVIVAERLRPALRRGKCVVYCRRAGDGTWAAITGAPGDPAKEDRSDARR